MRTYPCSYMIFLSEEQRAWIQAVSKKTGASSAQYVRNLIQAEIEKAKGKKENKNGVQN